MLVKNDNAAAKVKVLLDGTPVISRPIYAKVGQALTAIGPYGAKAAFEMSGGGLLEDNLQLDCPGTYRVSVLVNYGGQWAVVDSFTLIVQQEDCLWQALRRKDEEAYGQAVASIGALALRRSRIS